MASIPGMGIPEQLKAAMEQEQSGRKPPPPKSVGGPLARRGFVLSSDVLLICGRPGKDTAAEEEMSIPGLDWGMDEVMSKDMKKVPQKKVPYAKPIPAQFQQVRLPSDLSPDL